MAGSMFRAAFPDWHSELHALIAEDDIVVERFTASGTQQGELMGVAPTGKHIELPGINIFRVRDGEDHGALGPARRARLAPAARSRRLMHVACVL